MKLLFLGDSLTDMGRGRNITDGYLAYGAGYVFDIASQLMYSKPGLYQIVNKGISGNKITDLFDRYQKDVIDEKPDVLTILIGVNDVWHKISKNNGTPIDLFEVLYLKMVNDIKEKLPKTRIIIMEPFRGINNNIGKELDEVLDYAKIVESIAKRTNSVFVPLQQVFDEAMKNGGEGQLLYDGVHTNPGGAYLIALEWLKVFKSL